MGERGVRNAEVGGSIPPVSTSPSFLPSFLPSSTTSPFSSLTSPAVRFTAPSAPPGARPRSPGVDGQGQSAGAPPGEDPAKQRREAESYVQLGLAGTCPVAAVVEPLPEILAEVVPAAPGREGGGDGVLAGAAGEDGPTDPQDQTGQLWLRKVRQMRFNSLLNLTEALGPYVKELVGSGSDNYNRRRY